MCPSACSIDPKGPLVPGLPGALATESFFIHTPQQVGKYLVSPLTRLNDKGRYAASVSIRSGRGTATHDRVLRFVPVFDTSAAAARYAFEQGMAWLDERSAAPINP